MIKTTPITIDTCITALLEIFSRFLELVALFDVKG